MYKASSIVPILSITGSDGTGGSGIQADIKTCGVLGGYALSVVTAVTVQNIGGIKSTHKMPASLIDDQMTSITRDMPPKAVKVGMICDSLTVSILAHHLRTLSHVVLDAAFISSRGERIATDEVIHDVCHKVMRLCDIVIMSLSEAQLLTGLNILNNDDMVVAARLLLQQYHMKAVIIQGAHGSSSMTTDLFVTHDDTSMPSGSYNTAELLTVQYTLPDHTNCNTHGLSGTLSASIATYLAKSYPLTEAVRLAYLYLQTLTVYAVTSPSGDMASIIGHDIQHDKYNVEIKKGKKNKGITPRKQEIYNQFMQLVANNAHTQHDVSYYASQMSITSRYLSQVTAPITGKSPKQIINESLVNDAALMLSTTSRPIQDIAFSLGFTSQSHLTKLFRQYKNVSPSAYRQQQLG